MVKKLKTKKFLTQKSITVDVSKIKDVSKLTKKQIDEVLNIFDIYGVVILQVAPSDERVAADNLRFLKKYFGNLESHKHSKENLVYITTRPGVYSDNVKRPQNDNGIQSPHTDGAFTKAPEIMVLYIVQPAYKGGDTILVDTEKAFQYLLKKFGSMVKILFDSDAYTVIRGSQSITRPVFVYKNGRIETYFSNHEYNEAIPKKTAKEIFKSLDRYIKDNVIQKIVKQYSGQIAIFRNNRILHGRTAWEDKKGQERFVIRAWYDGKSSDLRKFSTGFKLNSKQNKLMQTVLGI